MRKLFFVFCFSLLLAVILSGHTTYAASKTPSLYLNGAKLASPQPPVIVNGTTHVPVRVISESLGYNVGYDKADRIITIESGSHQLILHLDNAQALIDGKKLTMPSKPLVVKGYSLLPIRFIAEQFGLQISWNAKSYSVLLANETKTDPVVEQPAPPQEPAPVPVPVPDNTVKNTIESLELSADNGFSLSYTGEATYSTFALQNPNRIVIDVPNSAFADGFNGSVNANDPATFTGTIPVNNPLVKQIRYGLFDDHTSTIRFVVDLQNPAAISGTQNKAGKTIAFKVAPSDIVPPAPANPSKKFKVVIDAGHGGSDPGAISASGKAEKTFTLAVATKVKALLAKDSRIEVIMTRSGDTYPPLTDRSNLANKSNADVFVSIHANIGPSSANGTEVFYLHNNSKELAKIMHDNIQDMVGFNDRGVKTASFHVIRETDMPAVLLEMGFLSNPTEEKKLYNDSMQQTMAKAISLSVKEFLKL